MNAVLLIDFGSTYTKLTAVDLDAEAILGTASAYTTVQTDINEGLQETMHAEEEIRERMKTDKHLYFLPSDDFLGQEHIATSDGSHPTDLGFTYMLESISPKILKILRKYGIK